MIVDDDCIRNIELRESSSDGSFGPRLDPMPRATSEKFTRVHKSAPRQKEASTSGSVTNPIFNTTRFGQHILKNPQTCQRYGCIFSGSILDGNLRLRIVDAVRSIMTFYCPI